MKVNHRTKLLFRSYTGRVNVTFMILFSICVIWAYVSYLDKVKKDATIPWYALFFRVSPQPSWNYASPFDGQSK